MPHAERSTRDPQGRRTCPYCGYPIKSPNPRVVTCPACRDLPALEPLDDRHLLREDS